MNIIPSTRQFFHNLFRRLRRQKDFSLSSLMSAEKAAWILIALGVGVRLKHYLTNCSLWTDEAWVAVSLSSRSFVAILKGIEIFPDFSKPPLGFLLLAKSAIMALGNHEYALRLWSLIFGIGALFLFYRLVQKMKDKALTLITLGFFAFCPSLIYYSAELKQYALDLFIGLILYLVLSESIVTKFSIKKAIALGLLGAWAMWMSNAALFILAAFGATLVIFVIQEKRKKCFLCSLLTYGCWIISFWVLYKKFLSNMATNTTLFQSWQGAVLDVPLFSHQAFVWIRTVFLEMFADPLGFSFAGIAFVFFWIGFCSLVTIKRHYALLFLFSILIALLAAMAHQYPFRGRLLLFLVPGVLIFVVRGILTVGRKSHQAFALGLVIIFCLLLFAGPLAQAFQGLTHDYCREETREAMTFLKDHYRKGDFILLNSAAQFPLWYYGGRLKLAKDFEETWAGFDQGVMKKGVKIAKFWEGLRTLRGRPFILFRYEYNIYDKSYAYVKSLVRSETTESDIYLLFEGVPFAYPMEGERLWVILASPTAHFESIASGSLGLRFPQLASFKRKGISVYLYQVK